MCDVPLVAGHVARVHRSAVSEEHSDTHELPHLLPSGAEVEAEEIVEEGATPIGIDTSSCSRTRGRVPSGDVTALPTLLKVGAGLPDPAARGGDDLAPSSPPFSSRGAPSGGFLLLAGPAFLVSS